MSYFVLFRYLVSLPYLIIQEKPNEKTGGTPTGRVLKEVLDEQLNRLDNAIREGSYSSERPLDIIVLTDGMPGAVLLLYLVAYFH